MRTLLALVLVVAFMLSFTIATFVTPAQAAGDCYKTCIRGQAYKCCTVNGVTTCTPENGACRLR